MSVSRQSANTMFDLTTGCPVFTQDGEQLGDVKEISGNYFKVDAPMARDYWLSRDCILSCSDDRVTLNLTKDSVGDQKMDEPGSETDTTAFATHEPGTAAFADRPVGRPIDATESATAMPPTAADALISEDEQREQRERMERELAEQRRNLPNN